VYVYVTIYIYIYTRCASCEVGTETFNILRPT